VRTRTHFDRSSMQERAHCRPRSTAGRPRRHEAQQHAKWACTGSPKVAPATIARFRSHAHAHIAKVCKHASATQQSFPLPPLSPPADTRPVSAPTVARFRVPWVGTMTPRSVKPLSRWSSQIDASVTTASGIDLTVFLHGHVCLLDHAFSSLALARTAYAQRAGDRMLAASRLFERTWRTTLLEAVVRISQVSGCIPDRYQAATARSAQAGVVSPIELRNEQTGRNLTFGCWKYGIPSGLLDPLPTQSHDRSCPHALLRAHRSTHTTTALTLLRVQP